MALFDSGWIELIAVDGDYKMYLPLEIFQALQLPSVIDLRSTLSRFRHF